MSRNKYKVTVYERLRTDVIVEASSKEEALRIAENAYIAGDIVLGDRDYDGPEFVVSEDAGLSDERDVCLLGFCSEG